MGSVLFRLTLHFTSLIKLFAFHIDDYFFSFQCIPFPYNTSYNHTIRQVFEEINPYSKRNLHIRKNKIKLRWYLENRKPENPTSVKSNYRSSFNSIPSREASSLIAHTIGWLLYGSVTVKWHYSRLQFPGHYVVTYRTTSTPSQSFYSRRKVRNVSFLYFNRIYKEIYSITSFPNNVIPQLIPNHHGVL